MGMFDTVCINTDSLPVSESDKVRLRGTDFQTKSAECGLDTLYITNEGYLEMEELGFRFDDREGKPDRLRLLDVQGTLDFYTSVKTEQGQLGEWFEFRAVFLAGRLITLDRLIAGQTEHGISGINWRSQLPVNQSGDATPLTDGTYPVVLTANIPQKLKRALEVVALRQDKRFEQVVEVALRNAVASSTNLFTEEEKSQFRDYL